MKKKTYIIPSIEVAEIRFEGLMAGTVTNTGGNSGSGYGGEGSGGGRAKGRNPLEDDTWEEEAFFEYETDESSTTLW